MNHCTHVTAYWIRFPLSCFVYCIALVTWHSLRLTMRKENAYYCVITKGYPTWVLLHPVTILSPVRDPSDPQSAEILHGVNSPGRRFITVQPSSADGNFPFREPQRFSRRFSSSELDSNRITCLCACVHVHRAHDTSSSTRKKS